MEPAGQGSRPSLHRTSSGSTASQDELEDFGVYELDDFDDDASVTHLDASQRPKWWIHPADGIHRLNPFSRRRSIPYRIARALQLVPLLSSLLILTTGTLFPSYTDLPRHYQELRWRVEKEHGSANVHDEKIFIAASLYDHEGELLSGHWGQSVLRLIDILGEKNVFLSIYEDNADELAKAALQDFKARVPCDSEIVAEELDLHSLPHIATPDGVQRLKRIALLADVRNRALRPLEDAHSSAYATGFDKLLYLNDIAFDPVDAANLLFSTNIDPSSGRTRYRAACAMDFINPIKFYDTFATRDLEGYDMGLPFFPFFASAGRSESRSDVLEQKDAVRVKSCWGGMVAFEAEPFQRRLDKDQTSWDPSAATMATQSSRQDTGRDRHVRESNLRSPLDTLSNASPAEVPATNATTALRFRAETETYWDASECCLIHADLAAMDSASFRTGETGIYMNPYIRVAYSTSVLPWLALSRRFERLYTPIHSILNWLAERPSYNPRQFEEPGELVIEREWVWDDEEAASGTASGAGGYSSSGHFAQVQKTALPGGFCGVERLLYINEKPVEGESKWADAEVPSLV